MFRSCPHNSRPVLTSSQPRGIPSESTSRRGLEQSLPHATSQQSGGVAGWNFKTCCRPSRKSRRAAQRLLAQKTKAELASLVGDSKPLLPDTPKFKRVMLKLSGEALQGGMGFGVDPKVLETVAKEVAAAHMKGVQVAIVVGGGNYFRGANAWNGLDRATADYVGMLATCMNALCLQSALEAQSVPTRVQTAIEMREIAEPYIRRRAVRHLDHGMVVIFGAGTGNPFFTTDTAAALRAAEIDAQAFFKATKVDGVYDQDPERHPGAKLHKRLSFRDVTLQNLQVMDETAITLCKENNIPVVVFNLRTPGNIMRALTGDVSIGTLVAAQEDLPNEPSDAASLASHR